MALAASCLLVGFEALVRIGLLLTDVPQSPSALVREMQRTVQSMGRPDASLQTEDQDPDEERIIVIHPYAGYETLRGIRGEGMNLDHFRSEERKDTRDILVIGGSVAAIFSTSGRKHFIEVLERRIDSAERPIRVLPEARAGYKQPQQATKLAYLLSIGYEPDIVINIDGYNELALCAYNLEHGVFPAYPSLSHWGKLNQGANDVDTGLVGKLTATQAHGDRLCRIALGLRLQYSAVLGKLVLAELNRTRGRFVDLYGEYLDKLTRAEDVTTRVAILGPSPAFAPTDSIGEYVRIWKESSISMAALCRARGIAYLHVLQPTLYDEGSKPVTEEEQAIWSYPYSIDAVRRGYPMFREAGAELRQEGIPFLDASMVFKDVAAQVYYDPCHFRDEALDLFVEEVAAALVASLR